MGTPTGERRWRPAAIAAAIVIATAVAALYFTVDPAGSVFMPKCPVKTFTGFDCPGCGSQRMLHALLHLDPAGAWRANAFLFSMIPFFIVYGAAEAMPRRLARVRKALNSPTAAIIVVTAIVGWTLLRNLIDL